MAVPSWLVCWQIARRFSQQHSQIWRERLALPSWRALIVSRPLIPTWAPTDWIADWIEHRQVLTESIDELVIWASWLIASARPLIAWSSISRPALLLSWLERKPVSAVLLRLFPQPLPLAPHIIQRNKIQIQLLPPNPPLFCRARRRLGSIQEAERPAAASGKTRTPFSDIILKFKS